MPARTLLVIDDDDDIRESLIALLRSEGYSVMGASNALDALTLLAQGEMPNAIVLDLFMPSMSGAQFYDTIRRHPHWSKIPVIVCSAGPVPADVSKSAAAVLPKPFDLDRLLELVRRVCPA